MSKYKKLSAAEYRKMAAGNRQEAYDSFERCDTDGFLSQWALGINADLYNRLAELAENDWMSEFPSLHSIETGERVPAKVIYVHDRYSYSGDKKALWAIVDPSTGKFTGQFVPVGENSRKQKQLGFCQKKEMAPAYAKIDGCGRGLSGRAWVSVFRTDKGW